MTKTRGNKLQTPPSIQGNKKKRMANIHSDPPLKKKKFDELENDSNNENFDLDKIIKKKLLSDKKNSSQELNKKRMRDEGNDDEDDDDADELEPDTEDEKANKPSVQTKKKPFKKHDIESTCEIDDAELAKDFESSAERDKRTLFIKNLKDVVTVDDLKSLSKEIIGVRISCCKGKKTKGKKCAFIEFANESTAEKNKTLLTGKKIEGAEILIDYVGEKSSNSVNKGKEIVDPKILHVTGFKKIMSANEIMKYFPGAVKVDLPVSHVDLSRKDFVFVRYSDTTHCLEAHKKGQNMIVDGQKLLVQFARAATSIANKRRKNMLRNEKKQKYHMKNIEDGLANKKELGKLGLTKENNSSDKSKSSPKKEVVGEVDTNEFLSKQVSSPDKNKVTPAKATPVKKMTTDSGKKNNINSAKKTNGSAKKNNSFEKKSGSSKKNKSPNKRVSK